MINVHWTPINEIKRLEIERLNILLLLYHGVPDNVSHLLLSLLSENIPEIYVIE